jgi:hypothetical protein
MKLNTTPTSKTSSNEIMPQHLSSVETGQATEEVTQTRHQAIEQAAYWRASERGFASGGELDDWLGAEANVDGVRFDTVLE